MTQLKIRVPGKLMLMGEYAILEPGAGALVLALDRYLYVTIEAAPHFEFSSTSVQVHQLSFIYHKQRLAWSRPGDHRKLSFVQAALQNVLAYLEARGTPSRPFAVSVHSELQGDASHKLGLGSSAAVTVGLIAAVLSFQGWDLDPGTRAIIFKLSALSHRQAQRSGSGADIAACTYGGVVSYASYDPRWLTEQVLSLPDIIETYPWPHLSLEPLAWPDSFNLAIGWSGHSAETSQYIREFVRLKFLMPEVYDRFVFASSQNVSLARQAIREASNARLVACFHQARHLLLELEQALGRTLETPELQTLCELAHQEGGAAKLSGAGGGDCGIALVPSQEHKKRLEATWLAHGIQPVASRICASGVQLEQS